MPAFCRHNRLVQNCPICSREQGTTMNPVVSSSAPRASEPRERAAKPAPVSDGGPRQVNRLGTPEKRPARAGRSSAAAMKVRKLERGADDGYSSGLVQGLRSSADAERLAEEIAFATTRLVRLASDPPAALARAADRDADIEQRTWTVMSWVLDPEAESSEWPQAAAPNSYRAWVDRAGSQQAAFTGESYWTPERRFERIFERLGTLGELGRGQRFDLLVVLGRLGVYPLEAGRLFLSGENEATWAAKRALGIGDPLLLDRRAVELATACGVPLAALDLAFHNWNVGPGARTGRGFALELEVDADLRSQIRGALGV